MILKHIFVLFFASSSLLLFAQDNPALVSFSLQRNDASITLNWTIKGGYSCSGVKVEHSLDSINFSAIYNYPGVCGAATENQTYSYNHLNPEKSTKNYYRINLGNYGYSEILAVSFIDYGDNGYVIFPMPLQNTSRLYFNNYKKSPFTFTVFNPNGNIIHYISEITDSEIKLDKLNLKSGMYYFRLNSDNKVYHGSIIGF